MDVKTAYLNAPIDCEIYLDQPEGFQIENKDGKRLVYKLNKSLYGLKQSGRNWNTVLHTYLVENNFVQNQSDTCVYTMSNDNETIYILVWVDDLIIAASNEEALSRTTPSEHKFDCSTDNDSTDQRKYREAVGSLIYLMVCTRPDICWVVTKLSQYLSKPLTNHWTAVKHVFGYLKGNIDNEMVYTKCSEALSLTGYSDSDWASNPDVRRSLAKGGPMISWLSRKQQCVALSSCEAEYVALAVQESIYLKQMLGNIDSNFQSGPSLIYEDNQGAIALANTWVQAG